MRRLSIDMRTFVVVERRKSDTKLLFCVFFENPITKRCLSRHPIDKTSTIYIRLYRPFRDASIEHWYEDICFPGMSENWYKAASLYVFRKLNHRKVFISPPDRQNLNYLYTVLFMYANNRFSVKFHVDPSLGKRYMILLRIIFKPSFKVYFFQS